jgi:uncharacterized protein (TIGR03435 family)
MNRWAILLFVSLTTLAVLRGQVGVRHPIVAASPSFEVASVKPSDPREKKPGDIPSNQAGSPGNFIMRNAPLAYLLEWAYDLKDYQLVGPGWMNSPQCGYDIFAKAPGPASESEMKLMLRTLLIERFQMKVHTETRTFDVYALRLGKSTPKVKEAAADEGTELVGSAVNVTTFRRQPISRLSYLLTHRMDRPVVDLTGLKGMYDFTLDLSGLGVHNDPYEGSSGPSIFMAVEESLGLRLRTEKAQVEVLVVDYAEKAPTEN